MNIYVIKTASEVSQTQLNVAGVRSISRARRSTDGKIILEMQEDVAEAYFLEDPWFSLSEAQEEMAKPEWQGEEPEGFLSKIVSFLTA